VHGREIDHRVLEDAARRNAAARLAEEGQAGIRAFLERGRPPWADEA